METIQRAGLLISRWLARHLDRELLKFGDTGFQNTVMLLDKSCLYGPINLIYWWKFQLQFLQELVELGFAKLVVIPCA